MWLLSLMVVQCLALWGGGGAGEVPPSCLRNVQPNREVALLAEWHSLVMAVEDTNSGSASPGFRSCVYTCLEIGLGHVSFTF